MRVEMKKKQMTLNNARGGLAVRLADGRVGIIIDRTEWNSLIHVKFIGTNERQGFSFDTPCELVRPTGWEVAEDDPVVTFNSLSQGELCAWPNHIDVFIKIRSTHGYNAVRTESGEVTSISPDAKVVRVTAKAEVTP